MQGKLLVTCNGDLDRLFDTLPLDGFICVGFLNHMAHVIRRDNAHPMKRPLFIKPMWTKVQRATSKSGRPY